MTRDGSLAVDLNVFDSAGVPMFVTTLNTATDLIAEAGGPRYQWFTFIDGTIHFDNQLLERRGSEITLQPVAGRYATPTKHPEAGKVRWWRKRREGLPERTTAATRWPSWSRRTTNTYAALIVEGIQGQPLADLHAFSFDVDGYVGAGSPRMNLSWDNDGNGTQGRVRARGRLAVRLSTDTSHRPRQRPAFSGVGPDGDATVVSMSILVDEQGTSTISDVTLNGGTLGSSAVGLAACPRGVAYSTPYP